MDYELLSERLKAIADPSRLKIIKLLSYNGYRACELLEYFSFTQPTLSYHMKILCELELVEKSRDGRWIFYTLNKEVTDKLVENFDSLFQKREVELPSMEIVMTKSSSMSHK